MIFQSARFPSKPFDLARINVILGANGSGKSSVLSELRDKVDRTSVVYIEGGRTIKITDQLKFDIKNFQHYDGLEKAEQLYENKRRLSLADRLFDALVVLEKRDQEMRAKHSDEVEAWNSHGQKGSYPSRGPAPLQRVFDLFSEIFPLISLRFEAKGRRLWAKKGESEYGPSKLSDGEKQVFSILADLSELDSKHSLLIVDEPELNLHPELAERLWNLLELEFPDKRFVYATHSISFALRDNVEKVFVLSSDAEGVVEFKGIESLSRAETTAFLGGLPGILSANRVVVTEGHEKSFDAIFYRWLLEDSKLEIFPAGGSSDVLGVVHRSGLWSKISSRISLRGVIDADFKDDSGLGDGAASQVEMLSLHEAESYLCLPDVVVQVASRIGSQEVELTHREVEDLILAQLRSQRLQIAARRLFSRATINLGVSVQKKVLSTIRSEEDLISRIRDASTLELAKAKEAIGSDQLEGGLLNELRRIDEAIESRGIDVALRLLPGKELLQLLAPRAGCKNGADLMRALRCNFEPATFPKLLELKQRLERDV